MKKMKIIHFFVMLFLLIGNSIFSQSNPEKKGFALLELYTSEGCSSCPPADELMGRLQNELKEKNVYILSYHVDYWDRQGWKDIFSNADYTKRQYDYAEFLGKAPVYTPQLIINGKTDYIGSEETSIRNGIKLALSKPALIGLSLDVNQNGNDISVNYNAVGAKNSTLLIAVVLKQAKSNVKRGENANRILSHYQIVRNLEKIDLTKTQKGVAEIHAPKNFNAEDFEIIGFVQDKKSGQILGVSKVDFSKK